MFTFITLNDLISID